MRTVFSICGVVAVLAIGLGSVAASAGAATIDDFSGLSATDALNYSAGQAWYNPSSVAAPTFANVGGTFSPSFAAEQTAVWFRTTGEKLTNVGDTASIDFLFNGTDEVALGLDLDTATTGGPSSNAGQVLVQFNADGNIKFVGGSDFSVVGVQTGFSTLTVTNLGGGNYSAVVAGGGLAGATTFTNPSSTLFFGPAIYSSRNFNGGPVGSLDNLGFTAVPEPALLGVFSLSALATLTRRRR